MSLLPFSSAPATSAKFVDLTTAQSIGGAKSLTGVTSITASTATNVPLTIQGAASQTADLLDIKNSSGSILDSFDNNGNLTINGTNSNNSGLIVNDSGGHQIRVTGSDGATGLPYIGTYSNSPLTFGTNGNTNMTLLTNGNIGIGEINPWQALTLQGGDNISLNLAVPGVPSLASSTTGGTLATGTYYYKVTAASNESYGSETTPGPEASVAVTGPTGEVTVSWTAVPGAGGYKVYRGTTSGGENVYYNVAGGTTSFTDTGASSFSATPPTLNSAYGILLNSNGSILSSSPSLGVADDNTEQFIKLTPTNTYSSIFQVAVGRANGGFGNQLAIAAQTYDDVTGYPNQNSHVSINIPQGAAVNSNAVFYVGTGNNSANTRPSAIFSEAVGIGGVTPAAGAGQLVIQGLSSQSADLLDINNSSGTNLLGVTNTGNVNFNGAGGLQIKSFLGGTFINLPTTGPSAVGINGNNALVAYISLAGDWFANASVGDTAYRNTGGKLLFGNTTGNAAVAISSNNVGIGEINPWQALTLQGGDNISLNLAVPGVPSLASSTTGGTLATGTYYYKVTAVSNESYGSETTPGPEASVAVTGPTGEVTVSWTAVPGAGGYKVYRGTTSGGENVYYNVAGGTTSFTDTGASSFSATPPTLNSAYGILLNSNGSILSSSPSLGVADDNTEQFIKLTPTNTYSSIFQVAVGRANGGFGNQLAIAAQTYDDVTGYPNQNSHVSINIPQGAAVNSNAVFYVGTGNNSANTRPSAIFSEAVGIGGVTPAAGAGQLVIQGLSSQSADLLDINNSSGTVLSKFDSNGNLTVPKLNVTTGTNASAGTAVLVAGTVTVSTTAVTANSLIFLTTQNPSTLANLGEHYIGTITAGTSFVIDSSNLLDTSTVAWWIVN